MNRRDLEHLVLRLAVAYGLIQVSDVPPDSKINANELHKPWTNLYGEKIASLIIQGKLKPDWVKRTWTTLEIGILHRALSRSATATITTHTSSGITTSRDSSDGETYGPSDSPYAPTVSSTNAQIEPTKLSLGARVKSILPDWDRYEILEFIGEGGMGSVYKARDPVLQRTVALKFVHSSHPQSIHRFLNEARSQARVDHPNVCKVYEVAEIKGLFYIAMQFIQGIPLNHLPEDVPLDTKVRILKEVAEALHEAHRTGLIHRDVKPSNILVELSETGSYHPYILDFGLARLAEDSDLSSPGAIIGTPQYMAPEQARGEIMSLGRRTDVYGLGATMYEVMTGHLPFTGKDSVSILTSIIDRDPPPPRCFNPHLPRDLETIILKCLEKDPARRYDSAHDLAEDLQRYLDSEPILARRSSLFYRVAKKARKYRVLTTITLAATVMILILTATWIRTRFQAKTQATLAHRFGILTQEAEYIMRTSFMMPIHNIKKEKQMLKKRLDEIQASMKKVGKVAEGPGRTALGNLYYLLGHMEKAHTMLESAWNLGYQEPETAYLLGTVLGKLYEQELYRAARSDNHETRARIVRQARQTYRNRIINLLRKIQGTDIQSPHYIMAQLYFYEGQYNQSLNEIRKSFSESPWPFPVHLLEGDIYVSMALNEMNWGKFDLSLSHLRRSEVSYQKALDIARSHYLGYLKLCMLYTHKVKVMFEGMGQNPEADYQQGIDACHKAQIVDPEAPSAYRTEADLHWLYANHKLYANENPLPALEKARQAARKAVKLQPKNADILLTMGDIEEIYGSYLSVTGQDPRPTFYKAAALYEKALAMREDPIIMNSIGVAYSDIAYFESDQGLHLSSAVHRANEYLEKALHYPEKTYLIHNNLGSNYLIMALDAVNHGKSPEQSLKYAKLHFTKSLGQNPKFFAALLGLAEYELFTSWYLYINGSDPTPHLRKAKTLAEETAAINPYMQRFLIPLQAGVDVISFCLSNFRNAQLHPDPEIIESLLTQAQTAPTKNFFTSVIAMEYYACRINNPRGISRPEHQQQFVEISSKIIEKDPDNHRAKFLRKLLLPRVQKPLA